MLAGVHLRGHLHLVLRRRVALREEAAVRLRQVPLAAGGDVLDRRLDHRPFGLTGLRGLLPPGHPAGPIGRGVAEVLLELADLPALLGQLHQVAGRVDRLAAFMVVVQEGEQLVVVLLKDRIELVVVALGALDGQAEDALADGVHAIEHRLHAELLGIDAAFLVDHRVPQVAGRHDLILRGVRQLVAGDLLDDEPVVRAGPC